MLNYSTKLLSENNKEVFYFISKIHGEIGGQFGTNYVATEADIAKYAKRLENSLKENRLLCFIAELDKEIIGYVWSEINNTTLDIISVWTKEEYRNNGIAKKLKLELEEKIKELKTIDRIDTTVHCNNDMMLHVYKQLGYEVKYYRLEKIVNK